MMRMVFATLVGSHGLSAVLTEAGVRSRLLSFYELKDTRPGLLPQFISTGNTEGRGQKRKLGWQDATYRKRRRLAIVRRIKVYHMGEEDTGIPIDGPRPMSEEWCATQPDIVMAIASLPADCPF